MNEFVDKLPEIFGFKAEIPLADGIGGEGVELFDPRADDEFRERARLVQRMRGGFGCGIRRRERLSRIDIYRVR